MKLFKYVIQRRLWHCLNTSVTRVWDVVYLQEWQASETLFKYIGNWCMWRLNKRVPVICDACRHCFSIWLIGICHYYWWCLHVTVWCCVTRALAINVTDMTFRCNILTPWRTCDLYFKNSSFTDFLYNLVIYRSLFCKWVIYRYFF